MANNNLPVRVGASALAAQNPNVSDEMEAAGLAFGELISEVGTSVAKTQNALDANSAKSASDLATTMAEIVVAEQVQYSENGIYSGITETRTMKLPLITAIDPVFYKWSNVRLQGQFYANEFKTSSQVGTQQGENSSHTGQSGLLVVFGGGSSGYRSTNTTTTTAITKASPI